MYKRTKIVCTMGPACDSDETIREMIKAGMNVARFNFSHGSYDEHHGRIERVRRISKELGLPVGILLDTKGPEVRTGLLVDGKKVAVKTGDKIVVTAQPTSEDFHGTSEHISLDYLALPSEVEKGSLILIDDGLVALEVESVSGQDMTCVVKNDGLIGERKGVNMPNVNISLPAITERDRQDILFGLTENIDYIAASFIRDGESVRGIRELCRENGGEHVTIFPKIECALGVENFDEILEVSDGIIAPGYDADALEVLKSKKKGGYAIVQIDADYEPKPLETRTVFGVTFEQGRQDLDISNETMLQNVVTENKVISTISASTASGFQLRRGSKASRTTSANRLAASTSTNMKMKAATRLHHTMGSRASSMRAALIIVPKLIIVGSTPMPT